MNRSEQLFKRSQQWMPGGVNSPVRAFKAVGGTPLVIDRAEGGYLFDVDGRGYIDYVMSWGAMIAGHSHPQVIQRIEATLVKGLSFGAPTELELQMAETLCRLVPNLDQVRLVNSGTEATMSALRLARGVTGRELVVKFEGGYHGHSDALLVKAGSGPLTLGEPTSLGVSRAAIAQTATLPFNDSLACRQFFAAKGDEVAAVIVEPVAGNMSCVLPVAGFLETLRELCDHHATVLIFDEVMTGFRVALGGAQALYGVDADLITLGKIIGGGLPVGAYGGSRKLMQAVAPQGAVYQAGTLSGNPLTMAAGLANLDLLEAEGVYQQISSLTAELASGLAVAARQQGVALTTNAVGAMLGLFFTQDKQVTSYEQVMACDLDLFKYFFRGMLARGIYWAPSPYEAAFLSLGHDRELVEQTLEAASHVFSEMGAVGS